MVAKDLIVNGIEVWVDDWEIGVVDTISQKVMDAIEKSDYLAIILSPHSVSSKWVQKELNMAFIKEMNCIFNFTAQMKSIMIKRQQSVLRRSSENTPPLALEINRFLMWGARVKPLIRQSVPLRSCTPLGWGDSLPLPGGKE